MCLAIPGKVAAVELKEGIRTGRVQFGGIVRQACLDCALQLKIPEPAAAINS